MRTKLLGNDKYGREMCKKPPQTTVFRKETSIATSFVKTYVLGQSNRTFGIYTSLAANKSHG